MLPSISSAVCHIICTKEEVSFLIVKAKLGFVLCKSVGLVGLKTLDLVMSSVLGFHFKDYWITAFIYCPLMWWGYPIMFGIYDLGLFSGASWDDSIQTHGLGAPIHTYVYAM